MTEFPFISGTDIAAIENRQFIRIETDKAQEIVIALDKSGIPFSARYGETEMVLACFRAKCDVKRIPIYWERML